jgi:hypothetical protein
MASKANSDLRTRAILDASRDQHEEADYVGREDGLDRNTGYSAGLRQGGTDAIMILKQSSCALAAICGNGAIISQSRLHLFAALRQEAVTGDWGEIAASWRLQELESLLAADVTGKLGAGKGERAGFFNEEKLLFAAMHDQLEAQTEKNQGGDGLNRQRGPDADATERRYGGIALMQSAF